MLRSWHGLRAHPIRRSWKKLDIILSTSTEPQFFIDRPHESPFNVGVVLPLEDFLPEQVARLNALHPRPLVDADIQRLYRAGRRAPVSDAQGALHGGQRRADVRLERALRAGHRGCRAVRRSPALLPAAAAAEAGADLRRSGR